MDHATITMLGWDAAASSVVVAALAIGVATWGALIARSSRDAAKKSADQSERSAAAAERSAGAAEHSIKLQREALEIERSRVARERLEHVQARGPQWEITEPGEAGYFRSTDTEMAGQLRNGGLGVAKVTNAYLDCNGQRAAVRVRSDGPQGGGGWAHEVFVSPGAVLELESDITGMAIAGTAKPSLYIDFEQIGADTGQQGVTVELIRKSTDARGRLLWKPNSFRPGLLP